MSGHDDFAFEQAPGIPAALPRGEDILWQGRPATLPLAREAMWLNWVAGYFVLLSIWKFASTAASEPLGRAAATAVPFLLLGILTCLIILAIAWAQARATVYTITTARVLMRVGAALPVTFNIPFRQIGAANLDLRRGGTGTIAMQTLGDTRLSYAVLWPHVRPWHMKKTEPALRCIPDAARVAAIFAEAAETRVSQPVVSAAPDVRAVAAE